MSRYSIRERLVLTIGLWFATALVIAVAHPAPAVAGLAILAVTVLTFALAMSIVRPVAALHMALSQIRAGDHTTHVPHQNLDDEIGAVARAMHDFKERMAGLNQRNAADRLQHEEDRVRLIQELTTAYQESLTRIIDDVALMAERIAREYEGSSVALTTLEPPTDSVH